MPTTHDLTRQLGCGLNFGNALEAEQPEANIQITDRYLSCIKDAGFHTIRLPARWSLHADDSEPFEINRSYMSRIDAAVDRALAHGLNVVLNVHHYDDLCERPDDHHDRFVSLWRQIARRYANRPARLRFELLNEPHSALTTSIWNRLLAETLAVVRDSNPERTTLVGSASRNDPKALGALELPDDRNLIATIHYYAPLQFTHQGARWWWRGDDPDWLGTTWGSEADYRAVRDDMESAAAWSREHGVPVFLGEFGTYYKAHIESRVRWTEFVRSEAERLGFSWAYWDFATDFGTFDPKTERWRQPLLRALLGQTS